MSPASQMSWLLAFRSGYVPRVLGVILGVFGRGQRPDELGDGDEEHW